MNGALNIHPKVAGFTISGAVAFIVLRVLGHYYAIDSELSEAVTFLFGALGGYLAPLAKEPPPVEATPAPDPVPVDVPVPIIIAKQAEQPPVILAPSVQNPPPAAA